MIFLGALSESEVLAGISTMIAALAAIIAAALTSGLSEWLRRKTERKAAAHRYIVALTLARSEILFYRRGFDQLSERAEGISFSVQMPTTLRLGVPTYDIYPDALEKAKLSLFDALRSSDLVEEIGHCHYELCHIRRRLAHVIETVTRYNAMPRHSESLGDVLRAKLEVDVVIDDARGFRGLVESNKLVFENCAKWITEEIARVTKIDESWLDIIFDDFRQGFSL